MAKSYLIVVLLADRCQLLSSVNSDPSEVLDLALVAVLDALHLLEAVVTDPVYLAVVVVAQALQLLALVAFNGLENVSDLLGSRRHPVSAAVATLAPPTPAPAQGAPQANKNI